MNPGDYNDVKRQHTLVQFTITKRTFVRVQFAYTANANILNRRPEIAVCVYQGGNRTRDANNGTGHGKSFAWEFPAETGLIELAAFWKSWPDEEETWKGRDLINSSGGASRSVYDFNEVTVTIE